MILFLHPVAKLLRAFHSYEIDLAFEKMPRGGCNAQYLGLFISTSGFDKYESFTVKLQCPVSRAFHFYGIPPEHQ